MKVRHDDRHTATAIKVFNREQEGLDRLDDLLLSKHRHYREYIACNLLGNISVVN